jgi:alkylation response protein AidB-like acyl-CoA dehydrogenase
MNKSALHTATGSAAETPTLLHRVRAVLPDIAARSQRCEDERMVPIENITALRAAGFLDAFKPSRFGGIEANPIEVHQAGRELAAACSSTAWVALLLAAHAHAIAYYDARLQEEVWGDGTGALVSSSVAPIGRAEKVDGGYRLSGRYSWSSGCDHAQWAMLGFFLTDPETGARQHALAVLPRADYEIVDTWFASALRGTGSKDIVVSDVFVPDYRIETMHALNFGTARGFGQHSGPLYRLPFQPIFAAGFSTVALGIATAALEHYKTRLAGRLRAYTGARVAESAPAYMKLAESFHEVHAAALILDRELDSIVEVSRSDRPPSFDTMVAWRTHQAFATKLSVQAVDRVFGASGGGAILLSSNLQRCFRDVHAAAAHAYSDYDVASQILGRHLLGLSMDGQLL